MSKSYIILRKPNDSWLIENYGVDDGSPRLCIYGDLNDALEAKNDAQNYSPNETFYIVELSGFNNVE